ncbi:MAG: hypothetical protein ACRDK5_07775 [Solirubrobacterales bacterium]
MEQIGASQGPSGPATPDKPFYQRASFWIGPFMIGLGLLLAVGLAIAWYTLGGFPRDHDRYGEVAVPGEAVLAMPEGDVRLNFENNAHRSGDSTIIDDQPAGLEVGVTPAGDGDELAVDDVPSWLFGSTSGDRGHEPWGKIDVPTAGDYLVAATDDISGPQPRQVAAAPAPEPPSVDSGPAISVGQSPWTPFDSKLAGAILCGVVVMLGILLLTLPFRLFIPRD